MVRHKLIGIYQLITGIFGALLIIVNIGKAFENREVVFSIFLGIAFFSGLAYSGFALYNGIKNAVKYSIIFQAMQSVSIIYNGTQYLFTGSAFISFIIDAKSTSFVSQLSPIDYNISQISTSIPFELKIFIIPLIFILFLVIKK
jgi:hypothetical protein